MGSVQLSGKAQMNYSVANTLGSVLLASHGVHFYPATETVVIQAHVLLQFSKHDI